MGTPPPRRVGNFCRAADRFGGDFLAIWKRFDGAFRCIGKWTHWIGDGSVVVGLAVAPPTRGLVAARHRGWFADPAEYKYDEELFPLASPATHSRFALAVIAAQPRLIVVVLPTIGLLFTLASVVKAFR